MAAAIRAQHPDASLEVMLLDLSSLASVRDFAAAFLAGGQPLNILVQNAGVMACPFTKCVRAWKHGAPVGGCVHRDGRGTAVPTAVACVCVVVVGRRAQGPGVRGPGVRGPGVRGQGTGNVHHLVWPAPAASALG